MDINIILGIIGVILSVVSLLYAVYVTKKSKQERKFAYEIMPPAPIAEVLKGQSAYSLRVVYEKPGDAPVYIQHAVAEHIRFTNFGKIPINKSDIAQADPLRIEITGGQVLDVSLSSVTRAVCNIALGPINIDGNITTVPISFDFLDFLDGGLIQILSDSIRIQTTVKGTIIGMPHGIYREKETPEKEAFPKLGCAIGIIITVILLGATPFFYRYFTGSWNNVWTLLLPIIALFISYIVGAIVFFYSWERPKKEFSFPASLLPPPWYRMRQRFMRYLGEENSDTEKAAKDK
jgi:flagellar basal body-associated protein FliL